MSSLQNRHIVVGISAGIAAYKSPDLVRRLRDRGASVRVVMSRNAEQFITALTLQAVSGQPVHRHEMDAESESGMGHIDLARWADAVIIAPATSNLIARLAHGLADELLTTLCLATEAPVALAPAMNQQMWQNEVTAANIELLQSRGMHILGPGSGDQACGEVGPGRMLEPDDLATAMESVFESTELSGVPVMITAGPTWEAIDPVRILTNHSSGHMGYALARATAQAGARVTLISGPTKLEAPADVKLVRVISARDMHTAVFERIETQEMFIGVAAVADYRPEEQSPKKIKKSSERISIDLIKNPDILSDVAALASAPFTVGFAAETENVNRNARKKLDAKQLDLIVANKVGGLNGGFGDVVHSVTMIGRNFNKEFPEAGKDKLARSLVKEIGKVFLEARQAASSGNITDITSCAGKTSR